MNIRIPALAALALILPACTATSVMATPNEIKTIPVTQALMLESAITSIEENAAAWVNADGSVKRDAILEVLRADKNAWDQLDRYYNGTPPTATLPQPQSVEDGNLAAVTSTEDRS